MTPEWSLGAGIALGGVGPVRLLGGVPPVAGLGSMGYLLAPPAGEVLLEVRVGERVALMLDGAAHVSRPEGEGWQESGWALSGGLRWLLNPGDLVELSGFGMATGSRARSNGPTTAVRARDPSQVVEAEAEGESVGLGLGLGLALETALMDHLRLRLSSLLARADWVHVESSTTFEDGDTGSFSAGGLSAGVRLTPSVQLRMVF